MPAALWAIAHRHRTPFSQIAGDNQRFERSQLFGVPRRKRIPTRGQPKVEMQVRGEEDFQCKSSRRSERRQIGAAPAKPVKFTLGSGRFRFQQTGRRIGSGHPGGKPGLSEAIRPPWR